MKGFNVLSRHDRAFSISFTITVVIYSSKRIACFSSLRRMDGKEGKIEECIFTRDALLSNYSTIRGVYLNAPFGNPNGRIRKEKANLHDTMPRLISIEGSLWKTVRRMPGSAREHPLSFCTTKISLGYYHGARLEKRIQPWYVTGHNFSNKATNK